MQKSRFLVALLLVGLFVVAAAAYAITATFANENHGPNTEHAERYGEGKVIPPGWCLAHGYIGLQNTDDPMVCIYCD